MNEALTQRLRHALKGRKGITEKPMFGGACFMLRGHMLCGTGKSDFIFRIGRAQDAEALARPGARPMDITGRKMPGFVCVDAGCDSRALGRWIAMAEKYVGTLPPKKQ